MSVVLNQSVGLHGGTSAEPNALANAWSAASSERGSLKLPRTVVADVRGSRPPSGHQIYYRILVADVRRRAVLAKIRASEDLQRERIQQVRYGSALEADLIESRAHALQARQELLTTELQRSDLQMQLNDTIGLP
jgi:outer membrane protein TolC